MKMGLREFSRAIFGILVGAGFLTIWRLTDGETKLEQWMISQGRESIGIIETFGSSLLIFVVPAVITYFLLFGVQQRRRSGV